MRRCALVIRLSARMAVLVGLSACQAPGDLCEPRAPGAQDDPVDLRALSCFVRAPEPVLRDPLPDEAYEVASDGHVFHDDTGSLRMVYTGDADGRPAIKLASGDDWYTWEVQSTLLSAPGPNGVARNKETSFYRRANDGSHRIYFIGYQDEETYQSEIFQARAEALEGPWTIDADPVVRRGAQVGRDVYLMTSPSVVEHDGILYMPFLAWDADPNQVAEVWVHGVTSDDDGETWSEVAEADVPIGMEGQLTKGPDGKFYAVANRAWGASEGVYLGRADNPFGPYQMLDEPVLVRAGWPYEVHEANAPQLSFDDTTRTAYLYYVGANYLQGWWIMLATARY